MAGGELLIELIERLNVRLDRAQGKAFVNDEDLDLTPTEYRLLERLLLEPGRTFTRAELVAVVIAGGAVVLERTIDVHIAALRRKLRTPNLIDTVRGCGYRFRAQA